MLTKDLQEIFNKHKKDKWLSGNLVPLEEKERYGIIFISEKLSDHFLKRPELKSLGNFNATSIDKAFHCYLQKYNFGKIYATDMIKTQGKTSSNFIEEWNSDKSFKNCLEEEIRCYKPTLIVFMSNKVEDLFNKNFKEIHIERFKIYHPSYVYRYKKFKEWDKQFKSLKNKIVKLSIK